MKSSRFIWQRLFALHLLVVPIIVSIISAFLWPAATFFWVSAIAVWIGVARLLMKLEQRREEGQSAVLTQAVRERDGEKKRDENAEENGIPDEEEFRFEQATWTCEYMPQADQSVKVDGLSGFTFRQGESYAVRAHLSRDESSTIGEWLTRHGEPGPCSSAAALRLEVSFQTECGELHAQGWVECCNFMFEDQFDMISESNLDWSEAPSVFCVRDSRNTLSGTFDGEPTDFKMKYCGTECKFQVFDGGLQIECEFYDSINIQDYETACYSVPIERLVFPRTPKIYYGGFDEDEIDEIDIQGGEPVFTLNT